MSKYNILNSKLLMKWNNIMPLEFAKKGKRMRAFGTLNGINDFD